MLKKIPLKFAASILSMAALIGFISTNRSSAIEMAICPVPVISAISPVEVSVDMLANTRFTMTGSGFKGSGCLPPVPGTNVTANMTTISVQGPVTEVSQGSLIRVFSAESSTVLDTSLAFNFISSAGSAVAPAAGKYQATVTTAGGKSNAVLFFLVAVNRAPVISEITADATDVKPDLTGLQVYDGTTVVYKGTASDPDGNALTWKWFYVIDGTAGSRIQMSSGSGAVQPVSFTYPVGSAGKTYLWILSVTDGKLTTEKTLAVGIVARPTTSATPVPSPSSYPCTSLAICPLMPVQEGCFYEGRTDCKCGTLICPTPGPSPTPIVCTQEYFPICGSDGRTYPNECYLKAAGVRPAYVGVCGACATTASYACPPTPPGCQYVKSTTTLSGADACQCGTVVCPDATPSPTPKPEPTPITLACTNVSGYTSSCWQDGKRVINITNPRTESNMVKFTVVITMPTTANVNAIWNRAHYWSKSQNKWIAATLVGAKYPGASFNSTGEGYITGTGGVSLAVPTADATNGSVYVVSWDYTWQNNIWAGPKSTSCTSPQGCWRVESVPVPPSI